MNAQIRAIKRYAKSLRHWSGTSGLALGVHWMRGTLERAEPMHQFLIDLRPASLREVTRLLEDMACLKEARKALFASVTEGPDADKAINDLRFMTRNRLIIRRFDHVQHA